MSVDGDPRPDRSSHGTGNAAYAMGVLAVILSVPGLLGCMVVPKYTWPLAALAMLFGVLAMLLAAGAGRDDKSARAGSILGSVAILLVFCGSLTWWLFIGEVP